MGSKTRVGMLCRFKGRSSDHWYGYTEIGDDAVAKQRTTIWNRTRLHVDLGNRYVVVVAKKGALLHGQWTSFSKVIAKDVNGQSVIVWVPSNVLKPVQESRNNQSRF